MKSNLVIVGITIAMVAAGHSQTTRTSRPVDPAAIENMNRINDDRAKRGLKPLDAPGYTYVPADKRAPAAPQEPRPFTPLSWPALVGQEEFWPT